jgi:O-antigen/teichoic acid export membrane protein
LSRFEIPFREVSTFVLPLLMIGLVGVALESTDALLLGRFHGTAEVARIRAVQPLARVVQTVMLSFTLLFSPMAARLYARDDREGMNDLYWRTAAWIALLAFPIFATTFAFARPLTRTVYGARYANSGSILALLALGYFINGSAGLNEQALTVFRRLKYIVVVYVCVFGFNVTLMIVLARALGAFGAAAAKASSFILLNLLLQAGLPHGTGVRFFDARFARLYLAIAGSVLGLWFLDRLVEPPLLAALVVVGVVWLVLVFATRRSLAIGQIFPEIRKVPVARFLFSEVEPQDD